MQENELELVELPNLPRCYRLTNGTVELTIARDVGPRILGYNLIGAPNVLGLVPEASQATPWGDWKPRWSSFVACTGIDAGKLRAG